MSLSNKLLANLRFLKPENKNIGAEKMILGVAKSMPPKFRLSTREMDVLFFEWKLLLLEDLPEVKKDKDKQYVCVRKYRKLIFDKEDADEMKFPLIQKVILFAFSITEANADIKRVFS